MNKILLGLLPKVDFYSYLDIKGPDNPENPQLDRDIFQGKMRFVGFFVLFFIYGTVCGQPLSPKPTKCK